MKTKFFILLAAAVTALASCTSIIEIYEFSPEKESVVNTLSAPFTASVETTAATKTALSETDAGYALNWSYLDRIKIYSGSTAVLFETRNSYSTEATFTVVDNAYLPVSSKYEAFYPATLDKDNLMLPAKQTWARDNVSGFPMYAVSDTRSLSFRNLCGILRFRVNLKETGSSFDVSSITVSSEGKGMSGSFNIVDNAAVVKNTNTDVTLECPSPVSLYVSSTTDFYIYVPAGVYNHLKVKMVSSEGIERNYESDGAITVKRSGMTSIKLAVSTSSSSDGSTETISVTDVDVNFSER